MEASSPGPLTDGGGPCDRSREKNDEPKLLVLAKSRHSSTDQRGLYHQVSVRQQGLVRAVKPAEDLSRNRKARRET
jgi:hypothetical protein